MKKREHEAREDAERGSDILQWDRASPGCRLAAWEGLGGLQKTKHRGKNARNRDICGKYHLIPSDSIPSPNFYQSSHGTNFPQLQVTSHSPLVASYDSDQCVSGDISVSLEI